jgi:hydrogenase maturation protein HypF
MGRLFDAMSSLAGVCHRVAYEAEAAMRFEGLARSAVDDCGAEYEFDLWCEGGAPWQLDASSVVRTAAHDIIGGTPAAVIAARFHRAVAAAVVRIAIGLREQHAVNAVALSGGVFLNVLLTVLCVQALEGAGFDVLRHRLVPPSDAGLALGQIMIGARQP